MWAPCAGRETAVEYAEHVRRIEELITGQSDEVLAALRAVLATLAEQGRFDQAAVVRDRLSTLADTVDRAQRLAALAAIDDVVLARPDGQQGWELVVVRRAVWRPPGRRGAGSIRCRWVELLCASAETVLDSDRALPAASAEEMSTCCGGWSSPGPGWSGRRRRG